MAFRLSAPDLREGADIPKKFTCDGADVSPSLAWTDPPKGTKAFALICDDPDAPAGTWVHWVIYDLPADTRDLPEGVPHGPELDSGAQQGRNDFGKIGYNGPCPPRGKPHRYFFKLYALSAETKLKSGGTKADVERAMKGNILGHVELVAKFRH